METLFLTEKAICIGLAVIVTIVMVGSYLRVRNK